MAQATNAPLVGPLDQKMNERPANVVENKGALWETRVQGTNVVEKTGSYKLIGGMYLNTNDLFLRCRSGIKQVRVGKLLIPRKRESNPPTARFRTWASYGAGHELALGRTARSKNERTTRECY